MKLSPLLDEATSPALQRIIAALRTRGGQLALISVITILLAGLKMPYWWVIGIFLLLTTWVPARRKQFVLIAAICWIFLVPPLELAVLRQIAPMRGAEQWLQPSPMTMFGVIHVDLAALRLLVAAVCATFVMAFAYLWIIRRFPQSPPARRPVVGLIVLVIALFAATQPLRGLPWLLLAATAMTFNQYLWFFAYWVSESRTRSMEESAMRTYTWRPFWGFTTVPIGKGAAYLERVEAKDPQQLAESQWKGFKLLLLAAFWTAVMVVLKRGLFGPSESLTSIPRFAAHGRIPTYQMALDAMAQGHAYPLGMRWAALVAYFIMWVLYFTIFGHKVVGICRLAGFNVFRNTYKPHLATSIADFYNRIYYYFKELLVAFFFYPTYLRYFKKQPKLRLFVSTLAAAGFGNFLFHYIRTDDRILRDGLWKTLVFYRPYAFYALVLGTAIGLSQLRAGGAKKKAPTGLHRVLTTLGVWFFFCLICIIEEPNDAHGLLDYAHYFKSLFIP